MTPQEWRAYEAQRQEIISSNRSRRMQYPPKPLLDVPPKLKKPQVVTLYEPDGTYIGAWPFGVSEADAKAEAIEQGYKVGKTKWVDF